MTNLNAFDDVESTDIAIIGLAGRFPGARNVSQFWRNLCAGIESITKFSDEELLSVGVDPALLSDPNYVKAGAILEDIDLFDAAFFGLTPKEAQIMDPQHRLFLETAWQALESAGYDPEAYQKSIGLYAGSAISTYLLNNIYPNSQLIESVGTMQAALGNDKDSLATRVAYLLDLTGPCYSVQTYCSTSLVAVSIACSSLLNGECDMALAGGVALSVPQKAGYYYQEGGIASPDARCRAFDAQANGAPLGNGVGVVVLKRLEDAMRAGDNIYAVIKGSAINNDGSLKAGFTAPGVRGQAGVMLEAFANADIEADSIDYIEAHGTGTPLGDAVEFAALVKAFSESTDRKQFCALGSLKTNVGHLDRAAGVTGLIKTSLALKHELIPPSLNYQAPNPQFDLENSPFFVNTRLTEWKTNGKPRRAGVSAFGLGGTNAHVVVEEAPVLPSSVSQRSQYLLLLSARSEAALEEATQNLKAHLQENPDLPLADVAYTLQVGRRAFAYRRMLVCSDGADAQRLLSLPDSTPLSATGLKNTDRSVAWMFAGVGEHYVGMGRELYQQEAVYRQAVDQCCELALSRGWLTKDLRELLSAPTTAPEGLDLRSMLGRASSAPSLQQQALNRTEYAQPAVFVVEYALAQLWLSWGIRPQALIGYSVGEYVAACVAGALTLPDALRLVCGRAQIIAELPAGAMVAVALSEQQVQPWLTERLDLAIITGQRQCIVSGSIEAVQELEGRLQVAEIVTRRLETTHAFHSRHLQAGQGALDEIVSGIQMQEPSIPYLSNVTGDWISEGEWNDPHYWSRHMCETVRFAQGIERMWQQGEPVVMELGLGQSLGSFVKQMRVSRDQEGGVVVVPTLRARYEQEDDESYALAALGKVWLAGGTVSWREVWGQERRRRVPLPTYPFERQRYWIDVDHLDTSVKAQTASVTPDTPEAALESIKKEALADWFYTPGWKQAASILPQSGQNALQKQHCWLLFVDTCGVGIELQADLELCNQQVITVMPGATFSKQARRQYCINPGNRADYEALFKDIRVSTTFPDHIVHLWAVTQPETLHEEIIERGFSSLLYLAQAIGELKDEKCRLVVISNDVQNVTGNEQIIPSKATILGPIRVIPLEYPMLRCCTIDLVLPYDRSEHRERLIKQLMGELLSDTGDTVVALRGNRRWLQIFEPVSLPAQTEEDSPLRNGGTYLITGGLGGIGLAIAEDFAKRVQARLVLVSRAGLPVRHEWPDILAHPEGNEGVLQKIQRIRALEEMGSEVVVVGADVANEAEMRAVVQQTIEAFGILHGVIHAAGVPGIGLIQRKTAESAVSVMAPKMEGARVLERVLQDTPLDFLVLFSSITSATGGGPGQVDYCAANAFLDAYAQQRYAAHGMTISINWGEWQWNAWQQGLSGYDPEAQDFFKQHRQRFGISFEEGVQALQRILAYRQPQVVVSTQDFRRIMELSTLFTAATMLQKAKHSVQVRSTHARPALGSSYIAPRNEIERKVTAIWEEILGVTQIGVNDNFFELGGNSLIGIDLLTRLRQGLAVEDIPSYALYEAPSVSAMVQFLEKNKTTDAVEGRLDRGEKRRVNLKQRMHEVRTTRSK